ncbi:hypothetical protein ABZ837_16160 [Streptomyces sp. NPDC047197]|uniref:hypothetical protein n=1 Tax=Streptomyces sp. NPDC047197 TaxID=3155477 RepID=UPI0033F091E6
MIPVLLVLFVVLVAFGFLEPILWLAAAGLLYGITHYHRRSRLVPRDDPEYVEFRRGRILRDRFERRYESDRRRSPWSRRYP